MELLRVGVEFVVNWGQEEKYGVVVRRQGVTRAVEELMGGGVEGRERGERGLGSLGRWLRGLSRKVVLLSLILNV